MEPKHGSLWTLLQVKQCQYRDVYICTHANKTKGTFARLSACSKWDQCSCRVQTMFSPCGYHLPKMGWSKPDYYPIICCNGISPCDKRPQKSDPNQARYRRTKNWCRDVGNLGTWMCIAHLSAGALLYTSFIWNYHQGTRMGYIYIYIYTYIHIFFYNYAYVCICFWVINMYKPSSDWDAPPSMADSSAI